MDKKYKCGLYVGRFQPLHDGHAHIIEKMLQDCETVVVAIGSAQECGTQRNPFSYCLRATLIYKAFPFAYPNLLVMPVLDRAQPSNDPSWGDYLLKAVKTFSGLTPDVIYEGEEIERNNWYNNSNIPVVRVNRSSIPISATEIREAMLKDDTDLVMQSVPCSVWSNYYDLRKELLKCYNLQET